MAVKAKVSLDRSHKLIKGLTRANVKAIVDEGMHHGYVLMRERVHYITHDLENSLDYEVNTYTGKLTAGVEYAVYERARGGSHDFMTEPFNAAVEYIIAELQGLVKD